MVFAFAYLVLQKCQILSEGKGEALFSTKISNCLLFVSVVAFLVRKPFTANTAELKWYGSISLRICWHEWVHLANGGVACDSWPFSQNSYCPTVKCFWDKNILLPLSDLLHLGKQL